MLRLLASADPTIRNYAAFFVLFLAPPIVAASVLLGGVIGALSAVVPDGRWRTKRVGAVILFVIAGTALATLAAMPPTHPAVP
jgi:hypothetical protein